MDNKIEIKFFRRDFIFLFVLSLIFIGLKFYSFLLFHTLIEFISICISILIFIFIWIARNRNISGFYIILGTAYLFAGLLDLIHTISYKGIGVLSGYNTNLPTQLWIIARYIESISFFTALIFSGKTLKIKPVFITFILLFAISLASIFLGFFPGCYIENSGLTKFKIYSEYVICLFLIISIYLLFTKRKNFPGDLFPMLFFSLIAKIVAELSFTLYVGVYDLSNVIGHILKLISFYFFFRVVEETCVKKPYLALFKEISDKNMELVNKNNLLLQKTKNLEIALEEIKKLKQLIPICASCHKIRDDKGYWLEVEKYLELQNNVEITHGLCPDCAKKLYPELLDEKEN